MSTVSITDNGPITEAKPFLELDDETSYKAEPLYEDNNTISEAKLFLKENILLREEILLKLNELDLIIMTNRNNTKLMINKMNTLLETKKTKINVTDNTAIEIKKEKMSFTEYIYSWFS